MTNVIIAALISMGVGAFIGIMVHGNFKQKAEQEKQLATERKFLEATNIAKYLLLEAKN